VGPFRLGGDHLDPDEVTVALAIAPTVARAKGQILPADAALGIDFAGPHSDE
jgi:hypothetical protein